MHTKLAGHLSLHDMIANTINGARVKLASEGGDEHEKDEAKKKVLPFMKKKDGKEEEKEKKASAGFDLSDPDELEKLAAALEEVGDKVAADSKYIGGESPTGGETLSTMSAVPGKQSYKKDSSKSHNVPMSTGLEAKKENGKAQTATPDTQHSGHIPVTAAMPKKGVMKTAASSVKEKIEALKKYEEKEHGHIPSPAEEKEEKKEDKEKKASPVEYILSKVATFGAVEKKMGGETLDSAAEQGPKPSTDSKGGNNARSHISSSKAAIDMKKVEGKGPQKKMLSEVLTEPALSKAHDSKVQDNLRNASKGGVKIAAAKAFLQKIASEGCTCEGKGECKHCKMKKALEKKSMGGMSMGGSSPAMTTPPPMSMGR